MIETRDFFAGIAFLAFQIGEAIANKRVTINGQHLASDTAAYIVADAMIKAREGEVND